MIRDRVGEIDSTSGLELIAMPVMLGFGACLVTIVALVSYRPLRAYLRDVRVERAQESFQLQREWLEVRFFDIAKSSGRPKGLYWADVEWEDSVEFVRERKSGSVAALVGIAIRFEAIPGGGMEDNPNVSNLRDATAVFNYHRSNWITEGRALFNMNPQVVINRYQDQYEQMPSPEKDH